MEKISSGAIVMFTAAQTVGAVTPWLVLPPRRLADAEMVQEVDARRHAIIITLSFFCFNMATPVGTSSMQVLTLRLFACADAVRVVTCNMPAMHVATQVDST